MRTKIKNLELNIRPAFWGNLVQRFSSNRLAVASLLIIIILALTCVFVPLLSNFNFAKTNWSAILQPPSRQHFFGTDSLGRDLWVRTCIGGRITFTIAFAAALIVLFIGTFYGAIAGYNGGKVDLIMMRIVDILYGIPFLFFCILLITLFGNSMTMSLVAIAAISWLDMARIVRGQTLTIKHKEYIEAALILGVTKYKIIIRHIIPNLLSVVIIYAALTLPNMIILSAVLSFFGLGVTEPMTSWGLLIADGVQNMECWWLLLFPALLMTITLLAFAFVANGLRDALDHR